MLKKERDEFESQFNKFQCELDFFRFICEKSVIEKVKVEE